MMDVMIEPLSEKDVDGANAIFKTAFAAFLGHPDPKAMFGDTDSFRTRWRAKNTRVLGARIDGELVGSNVITRWGSLGWFGPLTIAPDRWDQGIAKAILVDTQRVFDAWHVTHRGLFTFPHSPKHVGLYQRFGYWPRYLTPILQRTVTAGDGPTELTRECRLFSQVPQDERPGILREILEFGGTLYPGLEVTGEIESLNDQRIGETVIVSDGSRLVGLATCHLGAGSEAGGGSTYVKFGAVAPGPGSDRRLETLVTSVEALGRARGQTQIEAGVNAAHRTTLRSLLNRGYRYGFVGVAMHSPDAPAYHRPELSVLDDWR